MKKLSFKKTFAFTVFAVLCMMLSSCDYLKYPKIESVSENTITYNEQLYTEVDLPYSMEIDFSDSPIGYFKTIKGYVLVYPSKDESQSFLRGGTTWVWMKQGFEIPNIYDLTLDCIYISQESREKIEFCDESVTLLDISTESVPGEECKSYNCIITVKEYDWITLSVRMTVDTHANKYLCLLDYDLNYHYMKISEQYSRLFNVE